MFVARSNDSNQIYLRPIRRIVIGALLVLCFGVFMLWRIDSPRVERFRAALIDQVVPGFDWASAPVRKMSNMIEDFQSYNRIYEQNRELRRELQQMKAWKEAAVQLEQQNAKLLALNNVRLDPKLTSVSGVVIADSGSPFRQSVLLNVGRRDGIRDGPLSACWNFSKTAIRCAPATAWCPRAMAGSSRRVFWWAS